MIAAVLFGPNYWSPNHDESSIEVFETLEDVIDMLRVRYMSDGHGSHPVRRLDGTEEYVAFPAFCAGTGLQCHYFPSPETSDSGVEDALTSIHNGWVDYICTLRDNTDGELISRGPLRLTVRRLTQRGIIMTTIKEYSRSKGWGYIDRSTKSFALLAVTFPNNWAASIVRGATTYGGSRGLFELAVLDHKGNLNYSTPITNDVIGHLTEADVLPILDTIAELPDSKGHTPPGKEKRYYYDMAVEQDDPEVPFGSLNTARIIDREAGGVVAYAHDGNVEFLVDALNRGEDS